MCIITAGSCGVQRSVALGKVEEHTRYGKGNVKANGQEWGRLNWGKGGAAGVWGVVGTAGWGGKGGTKVSSVQYHHRQLKLTAGYNHQGRGSGNVMGQVRLLKSSGYKV